MLTSSGKNGLDLATSCRQGLLQGSTSSLGATSSTSMPSNKLGSPTIASSIPSQHPSNLRGGIPFVSPPPPPPTSASTSDHLTSLLQLQTPISGTTNSGYIDTSSSHSLPSASLPPPPPPPPLRSSQGHLRTSHSHEAAAAAAAATAAFNHQHLLNGGGTSSEQQPFLHAEEGGPAGGSVATGSTSHYPMPDLTPGNQVAPLPLTQQDQHHHPHNHRLDLEGQSQNLDPYQDYFQSPPSGPSGVPSRSTYSSYEPISSLQQQHLDLRSSYGGYHDFSATGSGSGRVPPTDSNTVPALPNGGGPIDSSNYFYSSSSTPAPSSGTTNQLSNHFRYQHHPHHPNYDPQQAPTCFPPSSTNVSSFSLVTSGGASGANAANSYPAPQHHFQPSPAVLLHIKYVMEGIAEWMQFTDVVIVTGVDNQKIRAHRAILASHSTFLRQLMINNLEDLCENEEPTLVLKDMSYSHMKLMMQFFYTGEVSLSSQHDIQPLKEVCYILGVASLMARLDELSFSLQCLPNYDDPFKYSHPERSGHQTQIDPNPVESELNKSKDSIFSSASNDFPSSNDEVARVVEEGAKEVPQAAANEATNSFDTSFLGDDPMAAPDPGVMDGSAAVVSLPQASTEENKIVLEAQLLGKVKKKAFSCSECSSKFYCQEGLTAHERVHRGEKPYSCEICGVSSSTKSHLVIHMRKHSGEKPYTCSVCKKSFADQSAYKRHLAIHGGKKLYTCEICNKEYSDRSTCMRHQKEKHSEKLKKKFCCTICGKEFHRRETMATHIMKVHRGEVAKNSSSEQLGSSCQKVSKSAVDKFISVKEEEDDIAEGGVSKKKGWKSTKCPQCDMIFYKLSSMKVHLRKHTGDKPYVCEVCGKKFARSNNLKLHTRIHTGEKPYRCSADPDCGKAFSDKSALKRHIRTHTGERPYSCKHCQRTFVQLGTIRSHEKNCKGSKAEGEGKDLNGTKTQNPMSAPPTLMSKMQMQKRIGFANQQPHPGSGHLGHQQQLGGESNQSGTEFIINEDNSLSVMVGSETPGMNNDTLDSVRATCL